MMSTNGIRNLNTIEISTRHSLSLNFSSSSSLPRCISGLSVTETKCQYKKTMSKKRFIWAVLSEIVVHGCFRGYPIYLTSFQGNSLNSGRLSLNDALRNNTPVGGLLFDMIFCSQLGKLWSTTCLRRWDRASKSTGRKREGEEERGKAEEIER